MDIRRPICVVVLATIAICSGNVGAIPITADVTFSASGFEPELGASGPAPHSAVNGSFRFVFDDDAGDQVVVPDAVDLMINGFGYSTTTVLVNVNLATTGQVIIGGSNAGACCLITSVDVVDDFGLVISNFLSAPDFGALTYTITGSDGWFSNFRVGETVGTVTLSPVSVSAPATLALMAIGMVGIGIAGRRSC